MGKFTEEKNLFRAFKFKDRASKGLKYPLLATAGNGV